MEIAIVFVAGWCVFAAFGVRTDERWVDFALLLFLLTCVFFGDPELSESESPEPEQNEPEQVEFEDSPARDTAVQTRVAALRGAHALAREKALALIERGLRHPREEVQVAAIESIEALRLREAFEPMLSLSDAMNTAAVHTAAARALEASASVEDEALLLRTLCASSQSGEVRMAAARALGALGTGHAVKTLRTVGWGLFSGARGHAARMAFEQIHSRLGSASAGQLSVADVADTTGQLSVADSTGDLSFAQEAGSLVRAPVTLRSPGFRQRQCNPLQRPNLLSFLDSRSRSARRSPSFSSPAGSAANPLS